MMLVGRLGGGCRALRPLRRGLCDDASLEAFQSLVQRGLGVGEQMRDMREPMAHMLRKRGWFACDGLIGAEHCAAIRRECETLREGGLFSQSYSEVAETGEKIWRTGVEAMELRPDSWKAAPTLVAYVAEMMREVPQVMNTEFEGLSLSSATFGHKLAVSTGGGAHYPKHLDNTLGAPHDARKLTAILYLNPNWNEDNGGAIRLYDSLTIPHHTDIAPSGDRLLLFWSDLLVHEVLPCFETEAHGHRYTFTMWFASDNMLVIGDPSDALHPLRQAHYPSKS